MNRLNDSMRAAIVYRLDAQPERSGSEEQGGHRSAFSDRSFSPAANENRFHPTSY